MIPYRLANAGLLVHNGRHAKVVVAQIGRKPWLVMSDIVGSSFCNVVPFRKPLSPPNVVFRNWVILR